MSRSPLRISTAFYSSGTRCAAHLYLPSARAPAGPPGEANGRHAQKERDALSEDALPGVVLCHGFRGIKEWLIPPFAERFAEAGYAALTFDYRGFGESEGERGRLVPAEQVEDIRSAISFLGAQRGMSAGRIGLWGTSFGCGHAVRAASLDERAGCVVGQAGLGSAKRAWWDAMPEAKKERLGALLEKDAARRAITGRSGRADPTLVLDNPQSEAAFEEATETFPQLAETQFPLEAVERIYEYEPERGAGRIAPRGLLLIGATGDEATPPGEMRRLYEAAEEPKRLEFFEGAGHYQLYEPPLRAEAADLAIEWFDRFLAPSPAETQAAM